MGAALQFPGQRQVLLNQGHAKGMAGAAVLEELGGFPFVDVGAQALLGGGGQLDVLAGAIGDVLKELFEDQLLQVVLGTENNPTRGNEGLAVGWSARGGRWRAGRGTL